MVRDELLDLVIQAPIDAAGLAFMAEDCARPYLQSGALERDFLTVALPLAASDAIR